MLTALRSAIGPRVKAYPCARWNLIDRPSFGNIVFSQEGEDLLLCRIIASVPDTSTGVYVDVGSNHPLHMSNTALLYQRGWTGVAIDPNPSFQRLYEHHRPRDTFVNCGVSNTATTLKYFQFEESLFNTFDPEKARLIAAKHSRPKETLDVPVRRLDDILRTCWPTGNRIDFLSVDCEGLDLQVLESHDFAAFPPTFICAEVHAASLQQALVTPVVAFLEAKGYQCISKLCNSCLFLRADMLAEYGF
jgi:FkbM family methyltransferase